MTRNGSRQGAADSRSNLIGLIALLCSGLAQAADPPLSDVEEIRAQIIEQTKYLDELKRQLAETDAKLAEIKKKLGKDALRTTRGTGTTQSAQSADSEPIELAQAAPAQGAQGAPAAKSEPVGEAPQRAQQVAQIFEQPGILTPKGKFSIEPALQYGYSTNNRVAMVGYTIIPSLLIGLIDIREVHRNTTTMSLTGRYGVTNRFELEAKVPYVYRSDDAIARPYITGSERDELFSTSGRGIGDVEFTARYQFNDGGADKPYYIGSLRLKSTSGTDPFEVSTETRNGLIRQMERELPTGSGFYTIQPGLTVLYPADPAVFFGGISYQYNIERKDVSMNTTTGDRPLGDIDPGDVFGYNFGMGMAINEKSSFSIGYDGASIGKTKQTFNGVTQNNNSVRTHLGTLLFGYSHRLTPTTSLNVSVGAGVTDDTPDLQLTLRLPMSL